MEAPDFQFIRKETAAFQALDQDFARLGSETDALKEAALSACRARLMKEARLRLADYSAEELSASRSGIRTALLMQAGFRTLADLDGAADHELLAVQGIGEKQVSSIRSILDAFARDLMKRERIVLSGENPDADDRQLIADLARYRGAELIRTDAEGMREDLHNLIEERIGAIGIRGRFRWFFSGKRKREETVRAASELSALHADPLILRAQHFLDLFEEASLTDEEAALADFRKNSAAYYAMLEKLTGSTPPKELLYSSIPEALAAAISEEPLCTEAFKGDLRAYQAFGARYILHQKRVLLGDEMGLGKTIQAIAAMAHLDREEGGRHFLIVCPASVMTNWCRELRKFSRIEPHLLHGEHRDAAFANWRARGGAAVTSYEGMGIVADGVDGLMRLSMLVVDEAHYMKNPEAKRTKRIRRIEDESDRILLMTGTPLENKVDEMCELVSFVRPDLGEAIRKQSGLRDPAAFRELLAPVYLRRKREQVLSELPPVTESEEWCAMTPSDAAAYGAALADGNFMEMRRVSFLQEDLTDSAKAVRLKELCEELRAEGRKVVLYSFFRETIRKTADLLAMWSPFVLTGSTPAGERQELIDAFSDAPDGSILIAQIQAGGTGLNIQTASAVMFLEPQIKPSLVSQAVSRVCRMGQVRSVLVLHLLCAHTVDEAVRERLKPKQEAFDLYAEESALAEAEENLADRDWIRQVIEEQRSLYLPVPVQPTPADREGSV